MSEKDLNNQTQADRDDNNYDTLYKIRPFLDLINNSFKAAFTPYQSISVDESIIGFKAWLSWVQYMPKNTKWCIKLWAASDSATGYVWNFHLYIG